MPQTTQENTKGYALESPWFVVFDTETTQVKDGEIVEVGAIRVDKETKTVVSEYYSAIRRPEGAISNEFGEKHYAKVKAKCEVAPTQRFTLDEFLRFLRGPVEFAAPVLVGYCIKTIDLPMLFRHVPDVEHWLHRAPVYDVAVDKVFKIFPQDEVEKRKQEVIAKKLGINVDAASLHNPVYDCKLTLALYIALKNKVVEPVTAPATEPPVAAHIIKNVHSIEEIEWARSRFETPKYKHIRCPYCGEPTMYLQGPRNGIVTKADDYYYRCKNKDCPGRNYNGKNNNTLNVDGTKGFEFRREVICNIEDQLL